MIKDIVIITVLMLVIDAMYISTIGKEYTNMIEKIIKLSNFKLAITKEYPIRIYKLCY